MDSEAFRIYGKKMIDFVADYWTTMRTRSALPAVKPGYINDLVPAKAPKSPEDWSKIFDDLDKVVIDGATNWHHPHFFAYFPTACSYQSIVADILSGGIAGIGFSWKSCPSMTELEMSSLDWLVDLLGLPEVFKNSSEGPGCGIIQSTASDATLIAIMSARATAVDRIKNEPTIVDRLAETEVGKTLKTLMGRVRENSGKKEEDISLPYYHDPTVFARFVMYCSDTAHSSVEKGAMLSGIRLRKLHSTKDSTGNFSVSGRTLSAAIRDDKAKGLIPFMMVATLGTTSTCGVDPLAELGPICEAEKIWLHVDAAYAGSFLLCDEYRHMSKGIDYVDSFNFNPHKAMMINFDCSPMWFKNGQTVSKYFNVDALYLKHEFQTTASDYRHLQVALGRRFRSLKIWFILRNMGVTALQEHLRKQTSLAVLFADLIVENDQFELFVPQNLGLVCFKVKGWDNDKNEKLCDLLNEDRRIHLVPSKVHGVFFLRLSVCSQLTNEEDIVFARDVIYDVFESMKN